MKTENFKVGEKVVYISNHGKIRKGIIKKFEMHKNVDLAFINKEAVKINQIIRRQSYSLRWEEGYASLSPTADKGNSRETTPTNSTRGGVI